MKKYLLTFLILSIPCYFLWTGYLWRFFSIGFAGAYTWVESYDLKVTEAELVKIIKEIKQENPELIPPSNLNLPEGRHKNFEISELYDKSDTSEQYSYEYYIPFYYADTKEVVHTWIRARADSVTTKFAFNNLSSEVIIENRTLDSLEIKLGQVQRLKFEKISTARAINRDFEYFENRKQIRKFERTILDKIKEKIRKSST